MDYYTAEDTIIWHSSIINNSILLMTLDYGLQQYEHLVCHSLRTRFRLWKLLRKRGSLFEGTLLISKSDQENVVSAASGAPQQ